MTCMNINIRKAMDTAIEETKTIHNTVITELFATRFAELLLGDCDALCMKDYRNQGNYGAGYRLSKEMQRHFGVNLGSSPAPCTL